MIKKIILVFILILFVKNLSAVIISEVELNPIGDDAGNEWVEFYSPDSINLEGYTLTNNDGDRINLTGNFNGYFVYILQKQWLDNSNEKVSLHKGSELVDQTPILLDSANNNKTWQICEGWSFADSTKGAKNCDKKNIVETDNETTSKNTSLQNGSVNISAMKNNSLINEDESGITSENLVNTNVGAKQNEVIKLNAQALKTKDDTSFLKDYIKYSSIIVFGFLILFLIFLRSRRKRNEFE
ncbi:MAG: hypothetical protein AABW63_03815 [Nanoarchaeota archaeon]